MDQSLVGAGEELDATLDTSSRSNEPEKGSPC